MTVTLQLEWPALRETDPDKIWGGIAADSRMRADRVIFRIIQRATALREFPLSGRMRAEFS